VSFQSFHFAVFFAVVFTTVHFVTRKNEHRKIFLLGASYYFYMLWDWRFAGLLFFLTACNFVLGPSIHRAKTIAAKRVYLTLSLITSLGVLAYFKYAGFFIDNVNAVLTAVGFGGELPMLNVLLPVGISFFTFQSISYTLDIYKGRMAPVPSFTDFALFVAFFPQLVAGPIVRASFFLPQLERTPNIDGREIQAGIALMLRGFIKKIAFADILALHFVDAAFASPHDYSPGFLLLAVYAYSFQVYMDLSGYTDIARGVAKTLGYELQINFDRPYKAASVSNFWQRWHISMSSFFRDYLFFGLGGSRSGHVYVNVVLTFVAIGFWHGAGWSFVLYGLIHGAAVAWERWRRNYRKALGLPPLEHRGLRLVLQVALVFQFVALARILFRSGSISSAMEFVAALTDFFSWAMPVSAVGLVALAAAAVLHYTPTQWAYDWKRLFAGLPWPAQSAVIVGTVYMLVVLAAGPTPFIYFQF